MNALLIDAGNTRIKWALLRDGRIGPQQAVATAEPAALSRALARLPQLDRVVVCSVAGDKVERWLRAALRSAQAPDPEFAHSSAEAAGVRNGYRHAERLGADRWTGAVAAWHLAGCYRSVCAVSIGTALTIDVVDYDGRHRGGLIAPGPTLMLQSLLRDTAQIAPRARAGGRPPRGPAPEPRLPMLADDTSSAIEMGCLSAAAALVDRTITDVTRTLRGRPVVFLTGGGADAVAPLLRSACKPREDLVLRGLAILAGIPVRRRG
jgi:type III pantothenate kinase